MKLIVNTWTCIVILSLFVVSCKNDSTDIYKGFVDHKLKSETVLEEPVKPSKLTKPVLSKEEITIVFMDLEHIQIVSPFLSEVVSLDILHTLIDPTKYDRAQVYNDVRNTADENIRLAKLRGVPSNRDSKEPIFLISSGVVARELIDKLNFKKVSFPSDTVRHDWEGTSRSPK